MWVKYHEIMKNPNNLAQFKYLNNKHSDTKFKYTNQETGRSIISFFNKFNQPSSTSTNNWNVLSEKIDQGTSQLEVKDHSKKVRIQSQMTRTVCLPFIETSYILQKKKRQKSPESTNSKDNSQTSEQRGKKLKTDHNWFKQFETTFVFGSPNRNFSLVQNDENIVNSGIFNISPFISPRD